MVYRVLSNACFAFVIKFMLQSVSYTIVILLCVYDMFMTYICA